MFQVFVDSAANLPAVTAKKYNIHVVSFVNLVNGKELVCFDPDLSPEEELTKGKEYYNAMRGTRNQDRTDRAANFCGCVPHQLLRQIRMSSIFPSKTSADFISSARLAAEDLLEEYGGKRKNPTSSIPECLSLQGILAI